MKLVRLTIENYRKIKAAVIDIGKGVTKIGGKNAAGKTTALDAIEEGLAGARSICEKPVRTGEAYARNVFEFDNGMVVTRQYDAQGGSKLVVKDPKNENANAKGIIGAGQTFLDALTGKGLAFDPLKFLSMDPLKQLDTLKRMAGVDFSKIEDEIKALNDERSHAGRDVTGRKDQIESMELFKDVPVAEVSAVKLSDNLNASIEHNRKLDDAVLGAAQKTKDSEYDVKVSAEAVDAANAQSARSAAEIAKWQAYHEKAIAGRGEHAVLLEEARVLVKADTAELEKATQDAQAKRMDTDPLREAITNAEEVNRKVRANQSRAKLQSQFVGMKESYEQLTHQIEKLHRDKGKMIREAKLPVKGLEFGLQCVLYNGEPFTQASSAEQYRVSTAMSFELCPKGDDAIRIALIRNASLLDDESMAIITETAEKYGAQLVLEVVTAKLRDEADVDVVIEEGEARAPRLEPNAIEEASAAVAEEKKEN